MKAIVVRALLFLLPVFAIIAVYICLDPFKVIGLYANYKPIGNGLSVPLNQNRVGTGTFLFNEKTAHYNSFIFGSSRSMFYQVSDWKPHLHADDRCFHFDASAETLAGILHKIRFLRSRGTDIRNALLIFDADIFRSYQLLNEHLYMEDPRVVGYSKWLPFHAGHFMAFMDRKFMRAYFDYRITGVPKKYMTELSVLEDRPFQYDSITNEVRFTHFEALAEKGLYYTEERMQKFGKKRDGIVRFSEPLITDENRQMLEEIASNLRQSNCDTRVIISPLYDQIYFSKTDLSVLQEIMGNESVIDFSGINALTASYTGYYERSHYRPHLAKAVLDSVYTYRPH